MLTLLSKTKTKCHHGSARVPDENPTERAGISGINREIPIGPEKRYTGRPSPSIREPHFFLTFISPVNV